MGLSYYVPQNVIKFQVYSFVVTYNSRLI
jgi:hypothetical protein